MRKKKFLPTLSMINKNKAKLKIALPILSFLPNLGGMEVGLHNLATQLSRKGHKPVVITSYSILRKLRKKKINLAYEVKGFPPFTFSLFQMSSFLGFFYFKKIFEYFSSRYNFDFWHITSAFPLGISFIKYANKKKIAYLLRCVGEDIQFEKDIGYGYSKKEKNKKLIQEHITQAKNLVATSDSIIHCYDKLGVERSNIHKVTNGVVLENFRIKVNKNIEKKKYGLDSQALTLISVGRNHEKKNYDLILKIAQILKAKTKLKFQFIIVGKGVKKLKNKINHLNLNKNFFLFEAFPLTSLTNLFLPSEDLIKLYKISDIFIFPSLIESFGIVIIEAMATGIPLVVSRVPGSKDLVKNNENGFMVSKNNAQEFVKAIMNLHDNKKLHKRIKKNCLNSVKYYDWQRVSDKYIDLYKKIIKETNTNN